MQRGPTNPRSSTPTSALAACLAISCMLAAASAGAPAQPANQPRSPGGLQSLEPGMQDLDPLRTSLRIQPVDLRQPMNFDTVYRLPGSGATDRLVRMSGALAAVFPRSDYASTENGVIVLVPAGTIFHIGGIPGTAPTPVLRQIAPASAAATANGREPRSAAVEMTMPIDGREILLPQIIVNKDVASGGAPAAIMTDERYRGARIRQLLETAAAASPTTR